MVIRQSVEVLAKPMGKMKETKKSLLKRKKILQAAANIFSKKGYAEATLAEIGTEAGTHAGSLYYYFSSKEELVEEVLNIGTRGVSELVKEAVAALPENSLHYERIKVAFEVHISQMLVKDDFIVAYWKIVDQVPAEIRDRHLEAPREYGRYLQSLIDAAKDAGEIRQDVNTRMMRLMLVGSSVYALDWYRPSGPLSPKQIADTLIDMIFSGVGARCPEASGTGLKAPMLDALSI